MDEDVYFVDTRNADRLIRPTTVVRTPHPVVATPAASATRVTYSPPPQAVVYPAQYGNQFAPQWSGSAMYAPGPTYAQPPWASQLGGLFGGLALGDIIKLAADAFAAFKALPTAPTPTNDVGTDVVNAVTYLSVLAKDAADRKKVEFGGELAGGLTGRGYWGLGAR
jgi:hypothetical protein